ncbi:hypothetical protein [Chryseobacterium taichungense]|uniref:Uncharacterized protein n=1 Tax=Chryseobacterium taichungense TaxID=295069 RepID=A0A1H7X581_9FLAO|nr:hypothetical protein [Chryseobacterium taichungense]SEM28996.1 hypothetical protein SAMN05421856_102218 [Chryseobacterium taichungense]
MSIKLLLSGVLLLSLLAACSDRNEETDSLPEQTKSSKVFGKLNKEDDGTTAKVVVDSTKTKEIINATQGISTELPTEQGGNNSGETIDPTKPDRPK